MKTRLMLLPVLAMFLLLTSCKDSTSSDTPEIASMPLQVGNSWEYSSFGVNTNQEVSDTTLTTVAVVSDTLVDGIQWFKLEANSVGGIVRACLNGYYSNQDDGVHKRNDFTTERPSTLFLPNPGMEIPLYTYLSDDREYTVTYKETDLTGGDTKYNYIFRYFKTSGYELEPYDFVIQLSLESGITVYESAYYAKEPGNEDDEPLVLLSRQYVDLINSFVQ